MAQKVSIGWTGKPIHPIVCLYDVQTYIGKGMDLYFESWEEARELFSQLIAEIDALQTQPQQGKPTDLA